jgi:hypothetical protein
VRGAAVSCCVVSVSPPRQGGFVPLLQIKEGANHMRAALFSYVKGRGVHAVEWAAVRTILVAIRPSWPILYPNSGGFEGRRAVDGCGVF